MHIQLPAALASFVAHQLIKRLNGRSPDLVIGGDYLARVYYARTPQPEDSPTAKGWKNRWINLYLHHFTRSDDDRALHDHVSWNVSFILAGRYREHTKAGVREYGPGSLIFRRAGGPRGAGYAHRLELVDGVPVLTLFLRGPKMREWGFHTAEGWVHNRVFTGEVSARRCQHCGDICIETCEAFKGRQHEFL